MENFCTHLITTSEACLINNQFDIAINVCKNVQDKYQFLYASQLYGTFFAVFGKLKFENDSLVAIYLRLINYKGYLRLGLLPETKKTWNTHQNGHQIKLHLRANDSTSIKGFDQELKIDCTIDSHIDQLKMLFIDRELHQIYPELPIHEQLNQEVFDSEFFVKDGSFIALKPKLDVLVDNYETQQLKTNSDFHMQLDPRVCKTSFVTFV